MRIGLFVDGSNMFYAQKGTWQIDFARVYDHFSSFGEITEAYYVTGSPPYSQTEQIEKNRGFYTYLTNSGYTVITKEVKIIKGDDGQDNYKADLDVEMTMSIMAGMGNYDTAILMTGDSDFAPLVDHLRANGKQVWCVARRDMVSYEMRNSANRFIELDELRGSVRRLDSKS